MKSRWATIVVLGLMAVMYSASIVSARVNFDDPRSTYNFWVARMEQYEGKTEFIKMCYSQGLRDKIDERTKSPEGTRRMDGHHMYLNREIGKYEPGDTEMISDTQAVIWLTREDNPDEKAKVSFVLEDDGWKIDDFPNIGSERGLGGRHLAILAVVLFVVIIVLAKKVLLT